MDKRLFRIGLVMGVVILFMGASIGQSTVNIGEKYISKDAMKFCETYKSGNNKPRIINPYPKDGSENISIAGTPINVEIYDDDNDKMRSEIWSNFTGKWVKYAGWDLSDDYSTQFLVDYNGDDKWNNVDWNHYASSEGNLESGRYGFFENRSVTMNWKMDSSGTKYYWSVNVTDGIGWTNNTYHFTTKSITIYVDDNYDNSTPGWNYTHFNKIRDGIDAASEGNTVFVYSGYYEEYVILDKSIHLLGESRDSTFIFGKDRGPDSQREIHVVKITANNSEFSGFSIVGGGFESDGTERGIELDSSQNIISRNYVSNCMYGIYANKNILDDIKIRNNFIHGNEIRNCKCSAIYLEKSNDNTISTNTIKEIDCMSEFGAIQVRDSNSNYIVDNIIENSKIGINIKGGDCMYTVINRNKLNCSQTGLALIHAGARNLITSNDFLHESNEMGLGYTLLFIKDTSDIKLLGNYYQYGRIGRLYFAFVHVNPFGMDRVIKPIPVIDTSARSQPHFT